MTNSHKITGILLALVCITLIIDASRASAADPLHVLYFHRPPFYIHRDGLPPSGLLIDLVRDILQTADIDHRFELVPSKRVLDTIERGGNYCGIGWLKNPSREKYLIFSRPIHKGPKLVLLLNQKSAARLSGQITLADALKSKLSLGVKAGFSYGVWADSLIAKTRPNLEKVYTSQKNLITMLALGRIDLMLINHEEAKWVVANYKDHSAQLQIKRMSDAPESNLRYMVFSKQVDPKIIEKINGVILKKCPIAP